MADEEKTVEVVINDDGMDNEDANKSETDESEYDGACVVNVDEEEDEGRFDEFGNFIKNAYNLNYFRNEFQGEKVVQPYAVNVHMPNIDERDIHIDLVYECLTKVEMDYNKVLSIDKVGAKTFCLDFCDLVAKKFFMSSITQSFSKEYKIFALVRDSVKVTIGSLPLQMKDDVIFMYLNKFGEVVEQDVVYKQHHKYKTYLCERVYTMNSLVYELPSYTWINGRQLSIRYHKQPQTCKLCDKKGHKSMRCPLRLLVSERSQEDIPAFSLQEGEATGQNDSAVKNSYRDKLVTGGKFVKKPILQGKNVVNGWNNGWRNGWSKGGYRPAGFRPQWQGKIGTRTFGDFVADSTKDSSKSQSNVTSTSSANGSSSGSSGSNEANGKKDVLVNKHGRPILSVKIPRNYSRRKAASRLAEDQLLLDQVDDKIDEIGGIIGDNMFDDENADVSKEVKKGLMDLLNICQGDDPADHEIDFIKQMTSASAYNIKTMFEKDIKMLENCQKRTGMPIGARLRSPVFSKLMEKYFSGLEMKETGRKRPPSSPPDSKSTNNKSQKSDT